MKKKPQLFVLAGVSFLCAYYFLSRQTDVQDSSITPVVAKTITAAATANSEKGILPNKTATVSAPTPGTSFNNNKESQLPFDQRAERPDSSQILHLTSTAWIGSNKYDPHSPSFDALLARDSTAVPNWKPYKIFRPGTYDGVLIPPTNSGSSIPFSVYLFYESMSGLIKPAWLKWYLDDQETPVQDVSGFVSPFASQERYNKALHFPATAFQYALDDLQSCLEILTIPYIETSTDIKYIETVSLRCYCRKSAIQIAAIGQMAIEFQK